MINHPNRSLIRARNAFVGDKVYILLRDVRTSVGLLKAGTELVPMRAGMNNQTNRYERLWVLGDGRNVIYSD
jgi:hypothetical protein